MMTNGMYDKLVEKAFDFLNTDYDMILFPIHQKNDKVPDADGHWFTIAVNLEAKKFQIIDSARAPGNADFHISAGVHCRIQAIWNSRLWLVHNQGNTILGWK